MFLKSKITTKIMVACLVAGGERHRKQCVLLTVYQSAKTVLENLVLIPPYLRLSMTRDLTAGTLARTAAKAGT